MHGSRERHVVRWEARCALLDATIERLELELAHLRPNSPGAEEIQHLLEQARERRRLIGPSPRHKMG